MSMTTLETLALFSGVLMALAIFPQAYKIFKDKHARDVSIITFAILTAGSFIWTLYGFEKHDDPIISSYGIRFFAAALVLGLIIYYSRVRRPKA